MGESRPTAKPSPPPPTLEYNVMYCETLIAGEHIEQTAPPTPEYNVRYCECGGAIEFPKHAAGTETQCPHCGARVTLTDMGASFPTGGECP